MKIFHLFLLSALCLCAASSCAKENDTPLKPPTFEMDEAD